MVIPSEEQPRDLPPPSDRSDVVLRDPRPVVVVDADAMASVNPAPRGVVEFGRERGAPDVRILRAYGEMLGARAHGVDPRPVRWDTHRYLVTLEKGCAPSLGAASPGLDVFYVFIATFPPREWIPHAVTLADPEHSVNPNGAGGGVNEPVRIVLPILYNTIRIQALPYIPNGCKLRSSWMQEHLEGHA